MVNCQVPHAVVVIPMFTLWLLTHVQGIRQMLYQRISAADPYLVLGSLNRSKNRYQNRVNTCPDSPRGRSFDPDPGANHPGGLVKIDP